MTDVELLSRHALRSYSLFVLYFLLTQGPMSGYEIAQLIKERSHGRFKATAGNVYPHLHKLKEAGDVRAGEPIGGRERSCTRSPSKESRRCVKAPWKNGHPSKVCSRSLTTYWNVPRRPLLRKPIAIGRSKNTSLPKWGALEGKKERTKAHA